MGYGLNTIRETHIPLGRCEFLSWYICHIPLLPRGISNNSFFLKVHGYRDSDDSLSTNLRLRKLRPKWKCLSVDAPPASCPPWQYFCPKDLLTLKGLSDKNADEEGMVCEGRQMLRHLHYMIFSLVAEGKNQLCTLIILFFLSPLGVISVFTLPKVYETNKV